MTFYDENNCPKKIIFLLTHNFDNYTFAFADCTWRILLQYYFPQRKCFRENNDLLSAQIKSSQSRICSLELHVVHITTGWHRLIGCLELQVIFRGRATNYRALLRKRALHFLVQKMTYENKPSYGCWPPCSRTP